MSLSRRAPHQDIVTDARFDVRRQLPPRHLSLARRGRLSSDSTHSATPGGPTWPAILRPVRMRLLSFALAAVVATAPLSAQDDTVHVLRHAPNDTATVSNVITVIFDRPVAGRLDATGPASRLIRIDPELAGRAEWRDPVTIRFVPDEPMVPGSAFTVTIDTAFRALDGSRMPRPYQFSFRVRGPRLIGKSFAGDYPDRPAMLPFNGKLALLYSAPIDLDVLRRGIRLELPGCADKRGTYELRVVGQHPVRQGASYPFAGIVESTGDTAAARFHRVVDIETESPLPENCSGFITLPTTVDDAIHGRQERYAVRTAPAFRLSSFECGVFAICNNDELTIRFTADVKAADLKRYVHFEPAVPFEFREGVEQGSNWSSRVHLAPRTSYTIVVDSALRDVDGRPITGPLRGTVATGDYLANFGYAAGLVTVPAAGPHTIPLRHINVQSVRVTTWFIPEAKRARALSLAQPELGQRIDSLAVSRTATTVALHATKNVEGMTEIPLPEELIARRDGVVAFRIEIAERMTAAPPARPSREPRRRGRLNDVVVVGESGIKPESPIALIQLTRLAVHAKVGPGGASLAVTGLADARPRPGAMVRALDSTGIVLAEARADSDGIATLRFAPSTNTEQPSPRWMGAARYRLIEARTDSDRATLAVGVGMGRYYFWARNPLDAWSIGGRLDQRDPISATLFTDRGIYRPGEMVYLKGVIRTGILGALKVPARQAVRVTVVQHPGGYRDDAVVVRDTVLITNQFGTLTDSLRLRPGAALGDYTAELAIVTAGDSTVIASEQLRVAEYRAPEFLVTAATDSTPRYAGDTARVAVAARYLFGAPMGRTPLQWNATLHQLRPWEIEIPGAEGWTVGEWDWLSPTSSGEAPNDQHGRDTLSAAGQAQLRIPLALLHPTAPGQVEVSVAVTDLNEQVVTTTTSFPVHPARLYILAKRATRGWYWTVGQPATVQLRTVSPDGGAIDSAAIVAAIVRRRWRSMSDGGGWSDTTLRVDTVRTTATSATYSFTPSVDGLYEIHLSAPDDRGGTAHTTIGGWAIEGGRGNGPPYRLQLIASTREASVGDEVQVAFDSPFDSAQAWVTIEREQVLESRRVTVHRGVNTVPFRITAAHVPNVFLSVLLLAPRAPGNARPDSASELMRAGYVEVAVRTDPKRLTVAVMPRDSLYAPGDQARVRVRVTDAVRRGARSEVTLWAVDQGVLALTGYTTPDLIARLYQPRGLGQALWSTVPTVLLASSPLGALMSGQSFRIRGASARAQLEEVIVGEAGSAAPSLRTQFRSTAFYLASAVTNDSGFADLEARVPDNLTTYRVMAVAVATDDRFGSGDTTLLVSRQLVARPALPRFVRAADTLLAGAVVNARDGRSHNVVVNASSEGMGLRGNSSQSISLAERRGAAARFTFAVPARDSAPDTVVVRLRASDGRNGDAVETRLPVEPDFHPRTHTTIGSLRDRADVTIELPGDIDAGRSHVSLRVGSSPLVPMLAAWDRLRVYPYECTEQLASTGRALVAIWRATGARATQTLGTDPRTRAQQIADALVRRQRDDGGFRYWDDHDWTSPWLTAYAGLYLIEAREQGIVVDSAALARAATYLTNSIGASAVDTGGMNRTERRARRFALGDRVAVVDFLRRAGVPDVKTEDALLRAAPVMTWEDRLRLAEVLARRPATTAAAGALVDAAWRAVTRVGGRVDLPDSARADRAFPSRIAPAARLLTASIALRPDQQLLGGLIETVLQQGRAEREWAWNTQDYASVVMAMAALAPRGEQRANVTVSAGGRELISRSAGASGSSEQVPLDGLLVRAPNGTMRLPLRLAAPAVKAPVFYALSIVEVPSKTPVTPDIQGIVVERWYERFDNGQPVTSVTEGDLVRVRLRITVPADREFVAIEDPLPAGLEPVDLSLKTSGTLQPFATPVSEQARRAGDRDSGSSSWQAWMYGRWEDGGWSPWEHKAIHDDKVIYVARILWPGSYSASYVARATTSGSFTSPPAHAEEMYNPALQGRSDGGRFQVRSSSP